MSTTIAINLIGPTCAHFGCGCRVTDKTYCSPECESMASGRTVLQSVPANMQAAKHRINGCVSRFKRGLEQKTYRA